MVANAKKEFTLASLRDDEGGFALLMTIFVVALATLLVLDFSSDTLRYQRQSRMYQERIQADYVVKSLITLGEVIIQLPKEDGATQDSLRDPWHLIGSEQNFPIPGFSGESRITIVDETSRLNLNSIVTATAQNPSWLDSYSILFELLGFESEGYEEDQKRTLGDASFDALNQVAVIHDWLDRDTNALSIPGYGRGIESSSPREWFYNRNFKTLSELALVPGMTLERVAALAPYVNVRAGGKPNGTININTASEIVLRAVGFSQTEVSQILENRAAGPLNNGQKDNFASLLASRPEQARSLRVSSNEFAVFVRVKTSNVTRWGKSVFRASGNLPRRKLEKLSTEIM